MNISYEVNILRLLVKNFKIYLRLITYNNLIHINIYKSVFSSL